MNEAEKLLLEGFVSDFRQAALADEQISRAIRALALRLTSPSKEEVHQFLISHGLPGELRSLP